jgi:DedD protein
MSDPRTEQRPPQDEEESDFGSRLKVRLAIAGALVALALAAIPILDSLTGKKAPPQDVPNSASNIVSSAAIAAPAEASASAASAPVAASAAASSQPVAGAPTGPNLSQTPGMTATPPLSQPPLAAAPSAVPSGTRQSPVHGPQGQARPPAAAMQTHEPGKAFRPGLSPLPPQAPPTTARPQTPNRTANPAAAPQTAIAPPVAASPQARPAGSSIGYNVQLGLFSNMDNAQKLIAELRSKGIDVRSETRVHLAPFRTKAEAEQAIAKLRAMGYAPMLAAMGN